MPYKRMTLLEKMEIFKGVYQVKLNPSKIALKLNRSLSSITREIRRGNENGEYNPFYSEFLHLKQRKNQSPKLKIDYSLWKEIKPKLELRWSPEQISKFLNKSKVGAVSAKTIYNYVNFHMKGELKKVALKEFRRRGKKRKSPNKQERRGQLIGMHLIDERPKEIDSRDVPGHWEGDLIIGKNHKSALVVTVERTTRFVQIDLLTKYDAYHVRQVIERRFKKLKPQLRRTLTLDQGKENAEHKKLSERMKMEVYFCHPASPWEKGTCENTNGLIRDFFDGENDFTKFEQSYFSKVARMLNDRPRQTLGFSTPKEQFNLLR
jgi:transposase, IS30 family